MRMCSSACACQSAPGLRDRITHLLDHPTPVHLSRETEDPILHLIGQDLLLGLITMFEEFLDDIIAEDVGHQLNGVGLNLPKDLILLITVGGLQLLLDEPGTMLIAAKLDDMIVDVLGHC